MRVETMVIAPQTDAGTARYVGTVEAVRAIPLSLQSAGRVTSVAVTNGDRVHQGQVLLQIDNTQAMNAVQGAEAALMHAQDAFDRVSKVHAKGVVSDQKMVEIESDLAQAKSLYAAAKQRLEECTLIAPCEGVVHDLRVEKGQSVLPDQTLCTLLDVSAFNVRFTVPEAEVNGIKANGRKAKGTVSVVAVDTVLPMQVTETGMHANPLTHTYDVVAKIQGGADVLMSGMVAVVNIRQSAVSNQPSDIVIPAQCILLKPEGPTVWVMEDGKAVRRAITIDGYQADGVRVKEGLQAGDQLIIAGYQKLYTGCKVICD